MPRHTVLIAGLLVLAGCSSQPEPAPTQSAPPSPAEQTACQQLIAAVPDNLDGDALIERTDTTATWGVPAMTLTCGVDQPAGYNKSSEVYVINDISWYGEKQGTDYVFTAIGRDPLVQIQVPDTHSPEVNPLVDLAPVIDENSEVTGQVGNNG